MMTELLEQLSDLNKLGMEGVQAMLDQHNSTNPNKNPIRLIDEPFIMHTCKQMIANHAPGKEEQHQFVLMFHKEIKGKQGIHYSVLDLNLRADGKVDALVLDAAGDATCTDLVCELSEMEGLNQIYFGCSKETGNIQKDFFSCPVFSTSHAIEVQNMGADIFLHINRPEINPVTWAKNLHGISWLEMPPDIIKYGQSQTEWNTYVENYQTKFNPAGNELEETTNYRIAMHEQSGSAINLLI